jgi:hypothetical protein
VGAGLDAAVAAGVDTVPTAFCAWAGIPDAAASANSANTISLIFIFNAVLLFVFCNTSQRVRPLEI